MATFEKAIPVTLRWEGGFVNDPNDPGGPTNRGIIEKFFKKYASLIGLHGTIDELVALTEDQAKQLYRLTFWNSIQGDRITHEGTAAALFDAHVNYDELAIALGAPMNSGMAIVLLQHILDIPADGVFGPQTLAALNAAPQPATFDAYAKARADRYHYLVSVRPSFAGYLGGWLNRVNAFEALRGA